VRHIISVWKGLECVVSYGCISIEVADIFYMLDDPDSTEMAQIPSGQLYLVRSDSLKGSRECMCVF